MNHATLVTYAVADMATGKAFFTALLGIEPYADSPYYTGFRTGEMEVGLVPKAMSPDQANGLLYVDVADINGAIATLASQGAQTISDPKDVANGLLVATVKDRDGNHIGLRQFPKQ